MTDLPPAPEASPGDPRSRPPLLDMLDLEAAADEAEPDQRVDRVGYTVTITQADDAEVELTRLCEAAISVLIEERAPKGRLDLHLVDQGTIRDLNHAHMGSDEPTDVLAFPLDPDDFDAHTVEGPSLLGDVVLCSAIAFGQSAGHTGSFEAELLLLTIHGTLHVLGHDHGETHERLVMQERERHFMAAFGLAHPVPAP